MRRVRLLTTLVALCAGIPIPLSAQTVDEIVARHVEARGGYERIRAIETLKLTRTVVTPFATIEIVTYRKRPHLVRTEQGPAGQPKVPRGMNATVAWDVVQGKVLTRPPQLADEMREIEADFDGPLVDWRAKGHTLTLDGREKMPGGEAFRLKLTTRSGLVRYIYLDTESYLERRHTGVLNLPNDRRFDVVIDFDEWREVEGVKFPFDISEERTGKEPVQSFVFYTERIEANVPLDDSLFDPPAGQ